MDAGSFLNNREVRLSLLSLLGQIIIISFASATLIYEDVSQERYTVLIILVLAFMSLVVLTVLRLLRLAKDADSSGK
ncbi:hypothetical protein [Methanolobus halotolerans]|uniref:Uncharacterized protein n=1 Tax=Methanolobus halotolerans TaxID=2052935 RepID=A0A4E0QD71_9EURY|nr:hypothetical protein [Methanolobus halotolerans]TGC11321.1 hypothetical protein CUN85_00065 [Methanolobus halotolerans]